MANWLNLSSFLKRQNPPQPKRLPPPTSCRPFCSLALAPSDRWSDPKSLEDSCHRGPHWDKSSYIKKQHTASWTTHQWLHPIHNMNCTNIHPPFHIPCLWIIWWRPQSIRNMYYVFVFTLYCFFVRGEGYVSFRLSTGWDFVVFRPDLMAHMMPTWGSETGFATAARNAEDLTKSGQANPPDCLSVTSRLLGKEWHFERHWLRHGAVMMPNGISLPFWLTVLRQLKQFKTKLLAWINLKINT